MGKCGGAGEYIFAIGDFDYFVDGVDYGVGVGADEATGSSSGEAGAVSVGGSLDFARDDNVYTHLISVCRQTAMGIYPKTLACSCKLELFGYSGSMKCPDCGEKEAGEVIVKRSKRGREFFGCSRYPECKWVSWERPQVAQVTGKN